LGQGYKPLTDSNGGRVVAILVPAVTRGVTTATSKMELCQEEELAWHYATRVCDRRGLGTPVHCHTIGFEVLGRIAVAARGLHIVVWEERKQAVGI